MQSERDQGLGVLESLVKVVLALRHPGVSACLAVPEPGDVLDTQDFLVHVIQA